MSNPLATLPYLTRVQAIRRHVISRPDFRPELDSLPPAKRDQLEAAYRDVEHMLDTVADHPVNVDPEQADEITARLFATLADGHQWFTCEHLQARPITPGVTSLACRVVLCQPCAISYAFHTPPEDDDRCDMCGSHGHRIFWKLRATVGAALVVGDICEPCALAIGINTEKD